MQHCANYNLNIHRQAIPNLSEHIKCEYYDAQDRVYCVNQLHASNINIPSLKYFCDIIASILCLPNAPDFCWKLNECPRIIQNMLKTLIPWRHWISSFPDVVLVIWFTERVREKQRIHLLHVDRSIKKEKLTFYNNITVSWFKIICCHVKNT